MVGKAYSAGAMVGPETPGALIWPLEDVRSPGREFFHSSTNDGGFVFCMADGFGPGNSADVRRGRWMCPGSALTARLVRIQGLPFWDEYRTDAKQ